MFGLAALAAFACATALPAPSLRFEARPTLAAAPGGGVLWSASVPCDDPPAMVGARVFFALDFDLDGAPDAADTLGVSPADCGSDEGDGSRVALRRALRPAHAALLRALIVDPAGAPADSHFALTAGAGSILSISSYCARPKNGEPEWIEIRNNAAFAAPTAKLRLEGRAFGGAFPGALEPGGVITTGADTAELRIWRPGARLVALSSWPNLRNSADTLRLSLAGGLVLDSVIYPVGGAWPREACVSLESEEAAASAHGYALTLPSPARWRPRDAGFVIDVRAPVSGRYDLRVYDLDGRPLCALARNAIGPVAYALPQASCPDLGARRGPVILHLDPREGPGVRRTLAILP
ncbi:MAG TPA: lamin tail domain-containing protein [Fibrobacteria bacterium]|nr:lamin tail domain-containing protein [Fibrobacteria bacterium]